MSSKVVPSHFPYGGDPPSTEIGYNSTSKTWRATDAYDTRNLGAFPSIIVQSATDENGLNQPMVIGRSGAIIVDHNGKIVNSKGGTVGSSTATAGIQEAINALPAGGGRIFSVAGTYTITSGITIGKQSVILEGEGSPSLGGAVGTTLNKNITIIQLGASVDMFTAVDSTVIRNLSLMHLGLEGNSANFTGSGIDFSYLNLGNQSQMGLFDVRINDFKTNGIYQSLAGGSTEVNILLQAVEISNCQGVGIGDATPNTQLNTSAIIQPCILIGNGTNIKLKSLSQSFVDILSYNSAYAFYNNGGGGNNFIRIISIGDAHAFLDNGPTFGDDVQITANGDGSLSATNNIVQLPQGGGSKYKVKTKGTLCAGAVNNSQLVRFGSATVHGVELELEANEQGTNNGRIIPIALDTFPGNDVTSTIVKCSVYNLAGSWFNGTPVLGSLSTLEANPATKLYVYPKGTGWPEAPRSVTAGASPYTFFALPYDAIYIITTVNGLSALTLDGQTVAPIAVNDHIFVPANHTLVATWAITAPVFEILPI